MFLALLEDINLKVQLIITEEKGGPSSGHWGHAGRPGKVGGSLPGKGAGAAMSIRTGKDAKFRQAIARKKITPLDDYHASGVSESYPADLEGFGKVLVKGRDPYISDDNDDGFFAEVDAYKISEELGWNIVPPTELISDYDNMGFQSVQGWVPDVADNIACIDVHDITVDTRSYSRIVLLDMLTGNSDRHSRNIVIDTNGKCWAIDNNRAFYYSPADAATVVRRQMSWGIASIANGDFTDDTIKFHPDDVSDILEFAQSSKFNSMLHKYDYLDQYVYDLDDRIHAFEDILEK